MKEEIIQHFLIDGKMDEYFDYSLLYSRYVPRYERTPKNGWFGIHSVFATHVETVVLMSRKDT